MILTFLFLFLLCGIHFLFFCPQRGLCPSDQFHYIRQSHFGSYLTGYLWISEPHLVCDGIDLWFEPNIQ